MLDCLQEAPHLLTVYVTRDTRENLTCVRLVLLENTSFQWVLTRVWTARITSTDNMKMVYLAASD